MSTVSHRPTPISPHDLVGLGHRFGIDYQFPECSASSPSTWVARGCITELELEPALRLTLSDLDVLVPYASLSRRSSPWFLCVVLEGEIQVRLGTQQARLGAGHAFSAHFNEQMGLTVYQPGRQRLRTLNVSLTAATDCATLGLIEPPTIACLHAWTLPESLLHGLESALRCTWPEPRQRLLWQGLALQLLAHGIPQGQQQSERQEIPASLDLSGTSLTPRSDSGLAQRDILRLEQVRQAIQTSPAQAHRLAELAQLAAMSPSSLRDKFRRCYDCSVFDYLRQCRLEQARRYLLDGRSVQQAAHASGYDHATNFATAFRRQFGESPRTFMTRNRCLSASKHGIAQTNSGIRHT